MTALCHIFQAAALPLSISPLPGAQYIAAYHIFRSTWEVTKARGFGVTGLLYEMAKKVVAAGDVYRPNASSAMLALTPPYEQLGSSTTPNSPENGPGKSEDGESMGSIAAHWVQRLPKIWLPLREHILRTAQNNPSIGFAKFIYTCMHEKNEVTRHWDIQQNPGMISTPATATAMTNGLSVFQSGPSPIPQSLSTESQSSEPASPYGPDAITVPPVPPSEEHDSIPSSPDSRG